MIDSLAETLATSRSSRVKFEAALAYARAGRYDDARALAAEIGTAGNVDAQALRHLVIGETALEQGDPQTALVSFLEGRRLVDSWLARFGLGRAHLELGAFAEAHSELDRCLTRRGEATAIFFDDLPSSHYLPPLHYYLGRALEGLGGDGAAAEYQALLDIQAEGDSASLVDEARARLEAL